MVGVQGVGGVPEPQSDRSTGVRGRRDDDARARENVAQEDGVAISPEAQEAASVARYVQIAKDEPDVRADRVVEARAALERGEYKHPEVMATIAEKLSQVL